MPPCPLSFGLFPTFAFAKRGSDIWHHSGGAMLNTHRLPIELPCGSGFRSSIRFGGMDLKNECAAYRVGTIVVLQYNHRTSNAQQTRSIRHTLWSWAMLLVPAVPVICHPLVRQTLSCKTIDFWVDAREKQNSFLYQHGPEGQNGWIEWDWVRDWVRVRGRARVRSPHLFDRVGLEPESFLPRNECTWQYPMMDHCPQPSEGVGVLFSSFWVAGQ